MRRTVCAATVFARVSTPGSTGVGGGEPLDVGPPARRMNAERLG
jgi:hypothetical protein